MDQKDAGKARDASEIRKSTDGRNPPQDGGINQNHNTKKQALGPNTKR